MHWLKIYKDLKLLSYLKALIKNYFKLYYLMKNSFEKNLESKYYFLSTLFKLMQACLQKNEVSKMFIKIVFQKIRLIVILNYYFTKYYSSILQRIIFSKPHLNICI
jgi:hypothetical protein